MPQQGVYLIAGLGNPGPNYEGTRHNAGFMAVDVLAEAYKIQIQRPKFNVLYGRGRIRNAQVILAKPQSFMNLSGPPLQQLAHFYRIEREAIIVVHDEIDLAFQRLKIKKKGGDGGHKGIRSMINAFGSGDFIRVRLGVGRSEKGANVVNHVLSTFDREETAALKDFLQKACDAIVAIIDEGSTQAMNRFNQKLL